MKADPRGVVEHLRRAEREQDGPLADFLAGEIVRHLECLDAIEEIRPELIEAHLRQPGQPITPEPGDEGGEDDGD